MKIGIPKEIKTTENRVPLTSTLALTNATPHYVLQLANKGYKSDGKETFRVIVVFRFCSFESNRRPG